MDKRQLLPTARPAYAYANAGAALALAAALAAASLAPPVAQASPGPSATAPIMPIAAPRDRPYPGQIELSVDATDVLHRVYHVHETLSGVTRDSVLFYPQWLPGAHAPEGTIDRLAGLRFSVDGVPVTWMRDPANIWAFRVRVPSGVSTLRIDFDYLSPTRDDVGDLEVSPDLLMIEWNEVVLYPAGYFSRDIPVRVSVTLPTGWRFGCALDVDHTDGAQTTFKPTNLATFVDSPLYAGRYTSRVDLAPGAAVPVHLDLFADQPDDLSMSASELQGFRALVQQAYRLFGSHHYEHYDFLLSLSDQIQHSGLEHHQSSENGSYAHFFTEWNKYAFDRDLLAHEYTHSWNGKFRRPFDLWTPDFNVPMQDSLLWVYEGQTQYWGHVLTARAGLRTLPQTLDEIADFAAYEQSDPGHAWRPLQDTTNDEIINPRRPQSWRNYQLFEDYYEQGALLWLDVDTLIRQLSHGRRSLDDFARAFFGIDNGSFVTVTYTFEDLVRTLNRVQPYDWARFLRQRLDSVGPLMLDGIRRGGYRLVYTDAQSDYQRNVDDARHRVSLLYSIGVTLGDGERPGGIIEVLWGSPAFQAGLTNGARIVAVNDLAYSGDVLKDAIRSARGARTPIELIVRTGDHYRTVRLDYHGGLRYPHLERDTSQPALLDAILAPRP